MGRGKNCGISILQATASLVIAFILMSNGGCGDRNAEQPFEPDQLSPSAGTSQIYTGAALGSSPGTGGRTGDTFENWEFIRSEARKYLNKSIQELLSTEHDWKYVWRGDGAETLRYESGYQAFLFSGAFWDEGVHSVAVSESLSYLLGLRGGEEANLETMARKLGDSYAWVSEKSCYEYRFSDFALRVYANKTNAEILGEKPNALLFVPGMEPPREGTDVWLLEQGFAIADNVTGGGVALEYLGWGLANRLAGILGMTYDEFVETKGDGEFVDGGASNVTASLRETDTGITYNFGEMRTDSGVTEEICVSVLLPVRDMLADLREKTLLRETLKENKVSFTISRYDRLEYIISFEDSTEIFIPCDANGELLPDGVALLKKEG